MGLAETYYVKILVVFHQSGDSVCTSIQHHSAHVDASIILVARLSIMFPCIKVASNYQYGPDQCLRPGDYCFSACCKPFQLIIETLVSTVNDFNSLICYCCCYEIAMSHHANISTTSTQIQMDHTHTHTHTVAGL